MLLNHTQHLLCLCVESLHVATAAQKEQPLLPEAVTEEITTVCLGLSWPTCSLTRIGGSFVDFAALKHPRVVWWRENKVLFLVYGFGIQ